MPFWIGFNHWTFLALALPAMLIGIFAQIYLKSTFARYSKVKNRRHLTGYEAARKILDAKGLHHVRVELTHGHLTDHYDPRSQTVRLSSATHDSTSLAAVGVAAHEAGHAIQHAERYAPLTLRSSIVGMTNISSSLSMILVIAGMFIGGESSYPLIMAGAILFSVVAFFQLVTLPVEFNASRRAMTTLRDVHILDENELDGSRKVLTAAAMTYVAALIASLLQLLRLIIIAKGRR